MSFTSFKASSNLPSLINYIEFLTLEQYDLFKGSRELTLLSYEWQSLDLFLLMADTSPSKLADKSVDNWLLSFMPQFNNQYDDVSVWNMRTGDVKVFANNLQFFKALDVSYFLQRMLYLGLDNLSTFEDLRVIFPLKLSLESLVSN